MSRKSAGVERKPGQQQMEGESGTAVGLPASIDKCAAAARTARVAGDDVVPCARARARTVRARASH